MNRSKITGLGLLSAALSFMFLVADTSNLRGQLNEDENVFEQPIRSEAAAAAAGRLPIQQQPVQPTSTRQSTIIHPPIRQTSKSNQPARQMNSASKSNSVTQAGGVTPAGPQSTESLPGVTQVGGKFTAQYQPAPGTDPKRVLAPNPAQQRPNSIPAIPTASNTMPPAATNPANGSVVQTQGTSSPNSGVTPVSHVDPTQTITLDGDDASQLRRNRKASQLPPMQMSPSGRGVPPTYRGSVIGLNYGETSTERCLQLQTTIKDLERQNDELRQQNTSLTNRIKEREEQMQVAIREIIAARKELKLAKTDLERSKKDLVMLQEKVRTAEREHSAVLKSIGPLLQQLLESDEVGSLPPNPME